MPTPAPTIKRPVVKPAPPPPAREKGQTLSAGPLLEDRYLSDLGGFQGVHMQGDARTSLGVVLGRTGSGKSSLFQSCPNAYVINVDATSTPLKPRAIIWPGIRPSDGAVVRANPEYPNDPEQGIPYKLMWGDVRAKRDALIQMALNSVPNRPSIVVLDTVDNAVEVVRAWQLDEWNKTYTDNPKTSWDELDGRTAWTELYAEILQLGISLRNVGYGFVWVGHLGDKQMKLGNSPDRVRVENVTLAPGNTWPTILSLAEWVGVVVAQESIGATKRIPKLSPNGNPVLGPDKKPLFTSKTEVVRRVSINFSPSNVSGDVANQVKKRFDDLPDSILLPKADPWGAFSAAIDQIQKS